MAEKKRKFSDRFKEAIISGRKYFNEAADSGRKLSVRVKEAANSGIKTLTESISLEDPTPTPEGQLM